MHPHDIRLTETTLVLLRTLYEMEPAVRRALTRWFWDHGIDPSAVAVGLEVERDIDQGSVLWREDEGGGVLIRRWRYAGRGDRKWPAEFPATLVQRQERPAPRRDLA